MKQLITKMTGNNKNLVQLVSDRSTQAPILLYEPYTFYLLPYTKFSNLKMELYITLISHITGVIPTQDEKMMELEKENKKLTYQLDTQTNLVKDLQNKVR